MKRISLITLLVFINTVLFSQVKIACIGDDNTLGSTLSAGNTYPSKLQQKIGGSFEVKNFGVKNSTYKQGLDSSYWSHPKLQDVVAWQPDIVILNLGLEDTKTTWSKYHAWFLIEKLRFLPGAPHVLVCLPTPILTNSLGYDDSKFTTINTDLQSNVRNNEVTLIDARTPFLGATSLFTDGVYLNADGADSLASIFYNYINSNNLNKRKVIAVIGNSITEGTNSDYTTSFKIEKRYSAVLWDSLGREDYVVHNFGRSGATLLKETGDGFSYYEQDAGKFWQYSRSCEPDMVIIMLGTNDAKSAYNSYRNKFQEDALSLVDSFKVLAKEPVIFLCLPPKTTGGFTILPDTLSMVLVPKLENTILQKGIQKIDIHAATIPLHDGVHPTAVGASMIAKIMYDTIKGYESLVITGSKMIPESDSKQHFVIPNPVIDHFKINDTAGMPFTIYSMRGEVVSTGIYNGEIDIHKLHSGIYVLLYNNEYYKLLKK